MVTNLKIVYPSTLTNIFAECWLCLNRKFGLLGVLAGTQQCEVSQPPVLPMFSSYFWLRKF